MTAYSEAIINHGRPFTLPVVDVMDTQPRQALQANTVQFLFAITSRTPCEPGCRSN
jgi:hypothetical protein